MAYPPEVVARGFTHYINLGSLRKAHRALRDEMRHNGAKNIPGWRVFGEWAKRNQWKTQKDAVKRKVDYATGETLAEWRARRTKDLDAIFDYFLKDPELIGPRAVPKLLELADRFRGGGEKHVIAGSGDGPVELRVVLGGEEPEPEDEGGDEDAG